MKSLLIGLAALVGSATLPIAAQAQSLDFSYTGLDGSFSFTAPSDPTPAPNTESYNGSYFTLAASGLENGVPSNYGGGIAFFESGGNSLGGLQTYDNTISNYGPQIFGGTITAPTFAPGSFTLYTTSADNVVDGTLTISAVPEPATWGLMLLGVCGIGFAFRRAKRNHGFRFKDAFAA